ncbi:MULTISPECIES: chromosomal replication initiator protein DnaA [unclassified Roseofilum]|uniref:chromosomal replication initiator protein DnaA n=1 Tax=unclassified Roseofilum TaxID=2620099 RepID=UPI000E91E96D|nr:MULTISPECIES: chromosomal replication initiator protein DnaA [unclassified Roseofilum]MBP0010641.1 chromosomal replication initiator protein DnaA [Roseofilum sp. Belize Diploria]MBP0034564.1 chromosomal replication initiator protein DnaA [Roseofilum sp. Belize BBD 4]HBQ98056.1 chromosomal replication initiator protein DnaA [Cyanobacteria bacterium UBA11691]
MENSLDSLWTQVLDRLEKKLSQPTFETWIKTAMAIDLKENCLILETPNLFARNWLQANYINIINTTIEEIVGHSVTIQIKVANQEKSSESLNLLWSSNPAIPKTYTYPKPTELNPKYVFEHFVVGSNNRMAHAASLAVAESPGRDNPLSFNPLFLYGGVGLGKTHLMQAIGHYRLKIRSDAKVFYVSTEKFTNDLITAIRQDSRQGFRDHYRTADVLLVDDIQFIEGQESTQEEFFHTFNTLHEAGKQVVLASDRPPSQMPQLQERLCSRFSMGLIADIQPPDLETRMAILQTKAEYENLNLPQAVIEYIATNYTSNIRELEGALIRTVAYMSISGLSMTVENIAPVLNPPAANGEVSADVIIAVVAEEFQVSPEDLKSTSRRREISQARQIGMYLMRQHTDLSLPKIGEEFGGKDHTTVMYSCDKVGQRREKDPDLAKLLRQLGDRITLVSRSQGRI